MLYNVMELKNIFSKITDKLLKYFPPLNIITVFHKMQYYFNALYYHILLTHQYQ